MRYRQTDVCLYFNFPKLTCYYRILKRKFKKNRRINDRAEGCKETLQFSLLSYIWTLEKRISEKIKILQNKYPDVLFVEINNNTALKKFKTDVINKNKI